MERVTISVDVGSSGIRSSAFTESGALVRAARCDYPTYYAPGGIAEQEPAQWENALLCTLGRVAAELGAQYPVAAIAVTGQCPTYVPVDRSLSPAGRALTYQDNRSEREAEDLKRSVGSEYIHAHSGHEIQPFFILPKMLWQKKHCPELFETVEKVLQPVDYLEYLLTGEVATDASYACGTLAYCAETRGWNHELLARLGFKSNLFPERIVGAADVVGILRKEIAQTTGLPEGTPVIRGGPDSQCCCYGVGALKSDILSNMSGTSTCLNSTAEAINADLRVGNYVHVVPGQWCMEVGLNTTGVSLNKMSGLLFANCSDAERYEKVERCATETAPGSHGLLFFPYLSNGERDNAAVKGGFYNLDMMHTEKDMIRAVMEGVAFAEKERALLMEGGKKKYTSMRISGGGSKTLQWNRIKASVMELPTYALRGCDAAEAGTAAIAAVGAGIFSSLEEALGAYRLQFDEYLPEPGQAEAYREAFEAFLSVERKLERG